MSVPLPSPLPPTQPSCRKPPITKTPGSGLGSASRPSVLRGPLVRARMRTTIAIRMRHILYLCPPQAQAQVLLRHTSQRGDGANRRKRDGRSAYRRGSPPFISDVCLFHVLHICSSSFSASASKRFTTLILLPSRILYCYLHIITFKFWTTTSSHINLISWLITDN